MDELLNAPMVYRCVLPFISEVPGGQVQKQDRPGTRGSPALLMRTEMGPNAGRHSALAESLGFTEVSVQGCQAELLASTVATIGPFLEDELSVDGQPMKLHLNNITITLKVGTKSTFKSSELK